MKFKEYLTEEQIYGDISYNLYVRSIDYLFTESYTDDGLNESIKDFLIDIKDKALSKISSIFKEIKKDLIKLSDDMKIDVLDIVSSFKSKNMFSMLKVFKFSIKHIFKSVTALSNLVRKGLFNIFEEIHKTGAFKKIEKGLMSIDDLLNKYPLLKKVGGIAIAGLIFYMWTQMTFIGD